MRPARFSTSMAMASSLLPHQLQVLASSHSQGHNSSRGGMLMRTADVDASASNVHIGLRGCAVVMFSGFGRRIIVALLLCRWLVC